MLRELQSTGAFSLRLEQQDSGAVREVRQLLKLNPDAQEFTLAMGETSKNDKEIAILSLLVMFALAESGPTPSPPGLTISKP